MKFGRMQKIKMVDGQLCRIIYCNVKNEKWFECGHIYEDGKQESRNLDYRGIAGWIFHMPGHKYKGYGEYYIAGKDTWGNYTPSLENFCSSKITKSERRLILSKYPEFRWALDKGKWEYSADIFKALKLWKLDARLMETLCSMGYRILALNGQLYRMTTKWDIVKEISRMGYKDGYGLLGDIQLMHKYKASMDDVLEYRKDEERYNHVNFAEWKYLLRFQDLGKGYYHDYMRMCRELGKDLKDPYWKYPKDLKKQHEKVRKEVANKRAAEEAILKAKLAERRKLEEKAKMDKFRKFVKMMAKFCDKTFSDGKISVMVPQSVDDVSKQAKRLNQCLIDCDYIGKVVKRECLLVFVMKDGKPYATAELIRNGRKFKIGQFYGNEHLKDYNARPDARKALEDWASLNKFNIAA